MTGYRVGITGHRQISCHTHEQIKNEIKKHLSWLIAEKGHDKLTAVTPLAAGADQLFAESALELGLPLEIILPFERKEYEKDFDKAQLRNFRLLLKQARQVEIMPAAVSREESYYQTGLRVLERCNELVAVWDFNKSTEIYAGTAHIVRQLFEKFPEKKSLYAIYSSRKAEEPLRANGYMTIASYQGKLIQGE